MDVEEEDQERAKQDVSPRSARAGGLQVLFGQVFRRSTWGLLLVQRLKKCVKAMSVLCPQRKM